jgi:hypothetical protein
MRDAFNTLWDDRLRVLKHILCSAEALPFVCSFPEGAGAKDLRAISRFTSPTAIAVDIYLKKKLAATFSAHIADGDAGLNKMRYQPHCHKKEKGAPPEEKPKAVLPGFSYEIMRRVVFAARQIGLSHVASGDVKYEEEVSFFNRLGFRFIRANLTPGNTSHPFNATALLENGHQPFEDIKSKSAIAIGILNVDGPLRDLLAKLQLPGQQEPVVPGSGPHFMPKVAVTAALK